MYLNAKHSLWVEGSYHWGEPETGYFQSQDEYVICKDMSMLSDVGVDALGLDFTNAALLWNEAIAANLAFTWTQWDKCGWQKFPTHAVQSSGLSNHINLNS